MLILKHLKTLQLVSIIIQIIFRELVGSLLKSLNLKIFKNVKGQLWWCGSPKHVEIILITNKSLFVASSWSLIYLLDEESYTAAAAATAVQLHT